MNKSSISNDAVTSHYEEKLWITASMKNLLMMKLTVLMTVLISFSGFANSFAQKITVRGTGLSFKTVIGEVQKQTNYSFSIKEKHFRSARPVHLNITDVDLEKALPLIFENQPFTYQLDGSIIVTVDREQNYPTKLIASNASMRSETVFQQVMVRGRVTNEKGEPLDNVSVTAFNAANKSTTLGSKTKEDGTFNLIVSSLQDSLSFSLIGYDQQVLALQGRANVNVVMKQRIEEIDDVVVTGIYERKASSYTGSVHVISKDEIKKVGSVNLFQALKNIAPSMVLDNFDLGSNPNAMPEIQIRGTSTFPTDLQATQGLKGNYLRTPNEPLFIVDGFESTVERVFDLDINRIESVTILKDAASKALYGSKAANGVIVIETTRIASDRPLITYNTSVDVELPDLTSYNLTNAREKLEAEILDGFYNAWTGSSSAPEEDVLLKQLYNQRRKLVEEGLDTYWLAKPLRNGIGQRHAISVELGSKDLRVITDLGYRQTKGVMIGSGRDNLTGTVTASYRLNNLLFRNITNIVSNNTHESPYGEFSEYTRMNPYWRAENIDGTIPYYAEQLPEGTNYTNPLYNAGLNSKNTTQYLNFINNFYLEWTLRPGLRAITRVGVDTKRSGGDEFYPSAHTKFEDYKYDDMPKRKGSYQVNAGSSTNVSGDLNINYSQQIGKHTYFANVGYNISERNYRELMYLVEGFPSDRMEDVTFGRQFALNSRPQGVNGIVRDMGFLVAASYMWDDRFMTDLTLRSNASSQFGADKRWALFTSAGLGWNLHNEAFLQDFDWLKQFKLRASIGSTGNQNFNTNASIATYQYYLDRFYQGFPGVSLNNMVNPGLQWESKLDYNAGFDTRLAGLTLRFDYYESYTKNLLTDVTIPYSTGFNYVKENLGKVKNQGFEVFASYLLWSRDRNYFSVNAGVETNKNKIVELSNAMKTFNDRQNEAAAAVGNNRPVLRYVDGMSMNTIWAVPSLGIDPANGKEIFVNRDGNTTYTWNANDMVAAGNSSPTYWGVLGLSGEYKGFGLSVNARFLGGGQYYNQTLVDRIENIDMNYNVDRRVLTGRWQVPGQVAEYRALGYRNFSYASGHEIETTRPSTRFIQNRKDLTISALNVYYDFQSAFVRDLKMERLRLAFNMNEVAQFSTIGLERGLSYPYSRTFQVSVMAVF